MVIAISPLVFFRPKLSFIPSARALFVCLSLFGSSVTSIEQFGLQLGTITGAQWSAEGVELNVNWLENQRVSFVLSAAKISHSVLTFPLQSAQIQCSQGVIDAQRISCEQGRLQLANPLLDNDSFPLRFNWEQADQILDIELQGVGFAGGNLDLHLHGTASNWQGEVSARRLSMQLLNKLLPALGVAAKLKAQGRADGELALVGVGAALQTAEWSLKLQRVAFSGPNGDFVGERLNADWRGKLRQNGRGYNGNTRLLVRQGALLTPFVYAEVDDQPIAMTTEFQLDSAFGRVLVNRFEYQDPRVISLSAQGEIELNPKLRVKRLTVRSQPIEAGRVYRKYLQPVLADDFFQGVEVTGGARFDFELDLISKLDLDLDSLSIRHGNLENGSHESFHLSGLAGRLSWSSADSAARSHLSWREGSLLRRITLGSGQAFFKLQGDELRLDAPLSLPLLDGELKAERLLVNLAESGARVDFSGYVTPISMELISEALGWPPLAGELSAMIPGVSYDEGELKLRGITLVRVFDGTILLKNLRLDDLFGPLPLLSADVELKALDLETLTSTFSFGRITGRLEGQINGLLLEQWRPVAFDARFATPDKDPGSHRINQKAVDNISNLGGMGISGALSRSYLRFFEEFGYEKLGISCRLENNVCEMGGIEAADRGYYLVKGGGLPRIDIIGFNRKTDWNVLVDKLKQVAEGGSPVIE